MQTNTYFVTLGIYGIWDNLAAWKILLQDVQMICLDFYELKNDTTSRSVNNSHRRLDLGLSSRNNQPKVRPAFSQAGFLLSSGWWPFLEWYYPAFGPIILQIKMRVWSPRRHWGAVFIFLLEKIHSLAFPTHLLYVCYFKLIFGDLLSTSVQ